MTCSACSTHVTSVTTKLAGVMDVNVQLLANTMAVTFDESQIAEEKICQAVTKAEIGRAHV